jgi:ribonuclease E
MGGLIVIDFIDMNNPKYRRNVERALKEALRQDRARIQVGHISSFGLLEMSRQRMGTSLVESTTTTCERCHGIGRVQLPEATAMQLMRNLQSFVAYPCVSIDSASVDESIS